LEKGGNQGFSRFLSGRVSYQKTQKRDENEVCIPAGFPTPFHVSLDERFSKASQTVDVEKGNFPCLKSLSTSLRLEEFLRIIIKRKKWESIISYKRFKCGMSR